MISDTSLAQAGPGLLVVLYLRMSDREQRFSVQQQREECRAYAASRGWIVVREYVDSGKSGSKEIAKRVEFHRMIADAALPGREWQAVLVWDSSRFGRLDALKGAPYKQALREANVWLETTKGEQIDWRTSMGRMMDAMKSEQDSEFSQKLSRDVRRGRTTVTQAGYLATPVPYGYDRQYVEGDKVRLVMPRRDIFSKPRNWRLVPLPNPVEAAVVKWAFQQWHARDMSLGMTIRELYDRGTPSPAGEPSWTLAQVKRLLTDRVYVGDVRIGTGGKTKEVHGRIGAQHRKGHHEALVDAETFAAVTAKVKEREGAEWRPKTSSGALSGILKCGKCGHTLARRTQREGDRVYNYYVCESASKRPEHGCSQWRAHEAEMLPVVAAEIIRAVDFEALRAVEAKPERRDAAAVDQLRAAVAKSKTQVERAAKTMLLVDPENFAASQDALAELRREHERQGNALKLAESSADGDERRGWVSWWKENRESMVRVRAIMPGQRPAPEASAGMNVTYLKTSTRVTLTTPTDAFRALLRRLDVSVHLHWTRHGSRNWKLTTGVLRAAINASTENAAFRTENAVSGRAGIESAYLRDLEVASLPSGSPSRRRRRAGGRRVRCR